MASCNTGRFDKIKGETGSRSGFFSAHHQKKTERVRISGRRVLCLPALEFGLPSVTGRHKSRKRIRTETPGLGRTKRFGRKQGRSPAN